MKQSTYTSVHHTQYSKKTISKCFRVYPEHMLEIGESIIFTRVNKWSHNARNSWGLSQLCQTVLGRKGKGRCITCSQVTGSGLYPRGWRWAINKVMIRVQGGGSLNYQLHWDNYSMTQGKYQCPTSLWMNNSTRADQLFFLNKSVHAFCKMCGKKWWLLSRVWLS